MRGTIKKRGNSYRLWVSLGKDPVSGKYRQKTMTVKGTKREAQRQLAELIHKVNQNTLIMPNKLTLGAFMTDWLKHYVWPNLAPRTADGYQYITEKYIIPQLGDIPLIKLKPEHLVKYYQQQLTKLSARSVQHQHMLLHNALNWAVKWEKVHRNVANAVSPPKCQRYNACTANEEEIVKFLNAAKDTPYFALFHTNFFTGMRQSELLALNWRDIDLLRGEIYITRTMHRLKNGSIIFRDTKTGKSRRLIELVPESLEVLTKHYETQKAIRSILGYILTNNDLVFCHNDGTPLVPDTVSHAWIKLRRKVGLNDVRFHDARHSHATILLKKGVHPKIVQERLGHSSIQITLDTYSHVTPGLQKKAALSFGESIASARESISGNIPLRY